jgi:hypothetical protein
MFGGVGLIAVLGIGVLILILLPSILPQTLNPGPSATFSQVPPTDSAASLILAETPRPELGFTIVEPQEVLNIASTLQTLEDVAVESYSEADSNRVNATLIFTVNSTPDVPLVWYWGWCAADEQTLEQNMTQINFVIEADGFVIPHDQLARETYDMDSSEAQYEGWKCEGFLTVLRDWQPGTYKLVETITFLSAIHDGKDAFEAGRMLRRYTVNISE